MSTSEALSLTVSRHFKAPPDRLFDLWTGPDWCRWFGPHDYACRLLELDPVVGGCYAMVMRRPDGAEITISGVYRVVERARRLAFSWSSGPDTPIMEIRVAFEAREGGTQLTIVQSGFPDDALRQGFEHGWHDPGGTFDKLAAVIEEMRA